MDPALPFAIEDGRYTVLAELGRGAHAVVYRARDEVRACDVAIKFLRTDLAERGVTQRFTREIAILSQLRHPHIVPVLSSGEWGGRSYFVSELAPDATLETKMQREGPLSVDVALSFAIDVAEALSYAHERGVVHRDVKPENILLSPNGALLADFGIARASGLAIEQAIITSTGIAVGTLLYMSPEQICAEKDIDGRCDQYALGLVLYEMLTGVRPHVSASAEGLRMLRLSGRQHSLRDHRPSVPPHVEAAVMRALAAAPADRFLTCSDFASALRHASNQMGGVPNVVPGFTAELAARRKRRVLRVGRVAAVVAVAAGSYAILNGPRNDVSNPAGLVGRADTLRIFADVNASDAITTNAAGKLRAELEAWDRVVIDTARDKGARPDITYRVVINAINPDSAVFGARVDEGGRVRSLPPVRFAVANGVPERALRAFASSLLGGANATTDSAPGLEMLREPKRSAVDAYVRAWELLRAGDLDAATSKFREAGVASPSFAPAHYWTAQTAAWLLPNEGQTWTTDLERALANGATLSGTDSLNAQALRALSIRDFPAACDIYRTALSKNSASFAAAFGLGECRRLDRIVLRDARSPTGMRFRSNHLEALRAYSAALDRIPSPRLGALFASAARITYASTSLPRYGTVETASGARVGALPSISGDSVVFWPIPLEFEKGGPRAHTSTFTGAIRKGRVTLLAFAERWRARAHQSFAAQLGFARALEMNGILTTTDGAGNSSLVALANAERLAKSADDSIAVGIGRTRTYLRAGDFGSAARVADSLLRTRPEPLGVGAKSLAPIAALLGQSSRLAALTAAAAEAESPSGSVPGLPRWLALRYGLAQSAAALNDCVAADTLTRALDSGFVSHFSPDELDGQSVTWFAPLTRAGLPCLGRSRSHRLLPVVPFDRAAIAWASGNVPLVRATLDSIYAAIGGASAASIAWDRLFAESWLLVQIGDSSAALRRLSGSLNDLSSMSEFTMDEVAQAAGLRNGLQLAAGLARARGAGADAAKWQKWWTQLGDPSQR